MKYILEQADVRKMLDKVDFNELEDNLYEAIEDLKDYANNSIYEDGSVGCYEDNTSFLGIAQRDLIHDIERFKKTLDEYLAKLKAIEPNL